VELTPLINQSEILDWIVTNLAQHIGTRPTQYMVASDVAELLKRYWANGRFDGTCGSGRPRFVLTGHSKAGGQAQFAAVQMNLDAIVFNADPVNPVIFYDWTLSPYVPEIVQKILTLVRGIQSIMRCRPNQLDDHLRQYFASGRVRDVRMVNDILAKYLLPHCDFPHAPTEWLVDTLTCSATDGHGIETVVRELRVCPP
jgi:hypothetical protein